VPGPTWTNRFFALTGTSNGRVAMPGDGSTPWWKVPGLFLQQDQDTIFDRLNEKGIHWKAYFHDIPPSFVLTHQRRPENTARYFYIDEFFDDARSIEQDFPQFCFIEPDFYGFQENDDHPPHDIMKAEKLIADVYNAIRENNDLWHSTLLVLFFDEHGGFYDHVVPPQQAQPPDGHHEEFEFTRFGARVPAILVSPWVDRVVDHTMFDHTSVLKYLIEEWGLDPLGERTTRANSIRPLLSRATPRADTVRRIELTADHLTPPDFALEEEAFGARSVHHTALQNLSIYLKASLVERIPRWYTERVRSLVIPFEIIVFLSVWAYQTCRHLFRRLFGILERPRASISEPDKLHTLSATVRDDVARFLMRKKRQSLQVLAGLIEGEPPGRQRDHATRTLAAITGRPFHRYGRERGGREQDGREHARQWLRQHYH
jgi:Phosphoesterase family